MFLARKDMQKSLTPQNNRAIYSYCVLKQLGKTILVKQEVVQAHHIDAVFIPVGLDVVVDDYYTLEVIVYLHQRCALLSHLVHVWQFVGRLHIQSHVALMNSSILSGSRNSLFRRLSTRLRSWAPASIWRL